MTKKEIYIDRLHRSVSNHDVYVLGGQGQTVAKILPVIPNMETGKNLTNCLLHISENLQKGYDANVMRAFDCSGLVTQNLMEMGILKSDYTADGLYRLMTPIKMGDLKEGDFVFQIDSKTKKMHHIGSYIGNNKVIESKGRLYGVVETDLSEYNWTDAARPDFWYEEPYTLKRKLKYVPSNMMRGEDVLEVQKALAALGYNVGTLDGIFGQKTENTVTDYQADAKVPKPRTFGVVGKTTAIALGFKWEG